jgi:hypothetical protein
MSAHFGAIRRISAQFGAITAQFAHLAQFAQFGAIRRIWRNSRNSRIWAQRGAI